MGVFGSANISDYESTMTLHEFSSSFSEFTGKNVLVTGHTGFKGSWLTSWLKLLGANVTGIALDPPTKPSHFTETQNSKAIIDLRIDIRNQSDIEAAVSKAKPDFVFHLAAQSLVGRSYENPIETWQTNVLGTLNVLESLRSLEKPCAAVIITSDKCYENVEWLWGYRENDSLGGIDPYSASKGAAELAIRSHVKSFFPDHKSIVRIASARAGNVIGGGDWATNRIIPDCVKSWSQNSPVNLRNPKATRPWQHVLEPLSGYLTLALALKKTPHIHGEAFNFGPQSQEDKSVLNIVEEMSKHWDKVKWQDVSGDSKQNHESSLLKLNCDKAQNFLSWHSVLNFEETVGMTATWYKSFYSDPKKVIDETNTQIKSFVRIAKNKGLKWAL
jgi:CDP-glucose 4,6-dehydratase